MSRGGSNEGTDRDLCIKYKIVCYRCYSQLVNCLCSTYMFYAVCSFAGMDFMCLVSEQDSVHCSNVTVGSIEKWFNNYCPHLGRDQGL